MDDLTRIAAGGALAIEEIKDGANAILDAHYPGTATGALAIAEALYGRFSPAGKLSYSVMPASFVNASFFPDMSMTAPPGRTYKYYPTTETMPAALWNFGSGLTYTSWKFVLGGNCREAVVALPTSCTVRVMNVGSRDSSEVVEVFFVPVHLDVPRDGCPIPKRQLIDFRKVHVRAGASVDVAFTVAKEQLELVSLSGARGIVAGTYLVEFTNGEDARVGFTVQL